MVSNTLLIHQFFSCTSDISSFELAQVHACACQDWCARMSPYMCMHRSYAKKKKSKLAVVCTHASIVHVHEKKSASSKASQLTLYARVYLSISSYYSVQWVALVPNVIPARYLVYWCALVPNVIPARYFISCVLGIDKTVTTVHTIPSFYWKKYTIVAYVRGRDVNVVLQITYSPRIRLPARAP
jgi:hypothetical protein